MQTFGQAATGFPRRIRPGPAGAATARQIVTSATVSVSGSSDETETFNGSAVTIARRLPQRGPDAKTIKITSFPLTCTGGISAAETSRSPQYDGQVQLFLKFYNGTNEFIPTRTIAQLNFQGRCRMLTYNYDVGLHSVDFYITNISQFVDDPLIVDRVSLNAIVRRASISTSVKLNFFWWE